MPEGLDARGRRDANVVGAWSARAFRDGRDKRGNWKNASGRTNWPLADRTACCKSGYRPYNRYQQHPPRLSTMRTLGGYFFRGLGA